MKTTVVYGAPCSGKTTYVRHEAKPGDIVFDYDEIAKALTFNKPYRYNSKELMRAILSLRSSLIREIITGRIKHHNVWIITTFLSEDLKKELVGTNYTAIRMNATIEECRERLKNNPDGRNEKEALEAISKFFTKSSDYEGFYNTTAWKEMRENILKRDGYVCQECKARGITTEATEVHHIFTVNDRPDLKLNANNLISLCEAHHKAMHDHLHTDLSKEGKRMQRRAGLKYGLYDR